LGVIGGGVVLRKMGRSIASESGNSMGDRELAFFSLMA
jgi:hypothetical protein